MSVIKTAMVSGMLLGLAWLPANAQNGAPASNIAPDDTRSEIAPRLPLPDEGRDVGPRRLLEDARAALHEGQTGAAQEALERAETRLLDLGDPTNAAAPLHAKLLQITTEARAALGEHNAHRAAAILDEGLAAMPPSAAAQTAPASQPEAAPRPPPQSTYQPAYQPAYPAAAGGWRWNGVQWVWAPGYAGPGPARWVRGHWAWRGAWVWVPPHWQ